MKSATKNLLKPGTLIVITNIFASGYNNKAAICLESSDKDCNIEFDSLTIDNVNGLLGEIVSHEDRSYPVAYVFALKAKLILAIDEFRIASEQFNT